jgi:TonB family protein
MSDIHRPDQGDRPQDYVALGSTGAPDYTGDLLVTRSPELAELIRRGVASVPALLEHLTDERPTGITLAFPLMKPGARDYGPWFTDGYWPRDLGGQGPQGVNTQLRKTLAKPGTYTMKVGDLCFVALGRIVGRPYFVVESLANDYKPGAEERYAAMFRGPPPLSYLSSPVEVPALAQAARLDWKGLTPEQHEQLLEAKGRSELDRGEFVALNQLFAYYPEAAERFANATIDRVDHDANTEDDWKEATIVDSLKGRDWPGLNGRLYRVFRTAVTKERMVERASPSEPISSSVVVALSCMKHLAHHGYDTELRAFAKEEIERLTRRMNASSPPKAAANTASISAPFSAYQYHIEGYETFLRNLDSKPTMPTATAVTEGDLLEDKANRDYVERSGDLSDKVTTSGTDQDRTKALWTDRAEVLSAIRTGFKMPPKLVSAARPQTPHVPWAGGDTQTVKVSFVVGENGQVEVARVLDSTDARFNDAALAGVRQWRFEPAQSASGPTRAVILVPIVFARPPDMPATPKLVMEPINRNNLRDLVIRFHLPDFPEGSIRGARLRITSAIDDTGYRLEASTLTTFYRQAVGRTSDDVLTRVLDPSIDGRLSSPLGAAKSLRSLEGVIEVIIPSLDPMATATIDQIPTTFGSPLQNAALSAAGVDVTVFDRKSLEEARPHIPALPSDPSNGEFDYMVAINDPQGRMVGSEFEAGDGGPLTYNHNGAMHTGFNTGARTDGYHFRAPLPPDAHLVCWLITPRSLVTIPFKLHDLPIPSDAAAR